LAQLYKILYNYTEEMGIG